MSVLDQAVALLKIGSPFLIASATYGFFAFLDRKASGAAKRAISNWIQGRGYEDIDVGNAIIGSFDNLYTSPLLSLDAIARSGLISIGAMALYLTYERSLLEFVIDKVRSGDRDFHYFFFAIGTANLLSDYISLFVVRRWLVFARQQPGKAMFGGTASGIVIIATLYTAITLVVHNFLVRRGPITFGMVSFDYILGWLQADLELTKLFGWPAFIIYLWLPLLAIGMIGVRALSILGRTTAWVQWFIKQGNQHPLQAIGFVAATLMFILTSIGHLLRYGGT